MKKIREVECPKCHKKMSRRGFKVHASRMHPAEEIIPLQLFPSPPSPDEVDDAFDKEIEKFEKKISEINGVDEEKEILEPDFERFCDDLFELLKGRKIHKISWTRFDSIAEVNLEYEVE